jgi:Uma2 family endonuclease
MIVALEPDVLLPHPRTGLYEVLAGEPLEKTMGLIESVVAKSLAEQFREFLGQQRIGAVYLETLFAMPGTGNVRRPDLAFVSTKTWPPERPIPRLPAWPLVPDRVIEVVSPHDRAFDVMEKVEEYLRVGVEQVGLVWSHLQQLHLYRREKPVMIVRVGETARDLLPGFNLTVASIFSDVDGSPDTGKASI